MKEKATVQKIEEMKSLLEKNKQINFSEHEKLSKRLDALKAEHEEQAEELMDQMLTLETKIDKFKGEAEEGESYDEDEKEDLGLESGDMINFNYVNNKVSHQSQHSSKNDLSGEEEEEKRSDNQEESDEIIEESRIREQLSEQSLSQQTKNMNGNVASGDL